MNPFLQKNLKYTLGKLPGLDRAALSARLANIRWPVRSKARVCEVTVNSACNNKCLFCYNEPGSLGPGGPEAKLEDVFKALYLGRRRGCWIAAIIGGEPTLRGDISKIAAFARKAGYACVKLCTNGSKLADPGYAAELAAAGFNMFDISLHGADAGVHDRLVGVKGAFSRAMRAAGNIRALGMELGTNQVLNAENYPGFPRFFEKAMVGLGINYYNIIYGHYRGSMARNTTRLKVRMSKTIPAVKEGLALLGRLKLPAFSRILVNYPPCLLPEYLDILADWEIEKGEGEPLLLSDGTIKGMARMKNSQSVKAASCAGCALFSRCRGVDAEYLALFGSSEFKPLASIPAGNKACTVF